jgi:hypothetical protein
MTGCRGVEPGAASVAHEARRPKENTSGGTDHGAAGGWSDRRQTCKIAIYLCLLPLRKTNADDPEPRVWNPHKPDRADLRPVHRRGNRGSLRRAIAALSDLNLPGNSLFFLWRRHNNQPRASPGSTCSSHRSWPS